VLAAGRKQVSQYLLVAIMLLYSPPTPHHQAHSQATYALETARRKAYEVCSRLLAQADQPPPDVVIGCDSVVVSGLQR
jgi:predicted house-cleaning NTP pyrophosphatase (Maf/HAM1 superfamily)